ncbi:malonyl-CoA:anthocyanidin 5-O-glucoside-6''-O-malonyltransferase-like isoform X2 [Panicum hallii]|uniref:malonyl-CoA:anthocyanidin 5-O-glucoside-6''-O-malonyltransferase-like isoform X2 n=1 Tax=Panicum hallii TaxID=206008 RepID=UPI000DF4D641|nr:malonyl-CoA:anthocyanidin 5-O-glucoside-6''-O-malonyltransferase-like isoform X2 [Panicum hallii]
MSPVRIVDISYVAVPAKAARPPEDVKLNAMEAQWLVLPLLQYILFFEGEQLPPFDTVVQSLRSSLKATLANFAPLAGKLVHLADTGDVAIRCSASSSDDGVRFVVAESEADVRRLAGDEEHDVQTFERLVPELDMTELPASLLAAQATRLEGGGVALGVTVHHAVADGRSLWRFVEAWAAACRRDTPPPMPPPCFDRLRVRLPGGEELARSVLRKYAPNLPVVRDHALDSARRAPAFHSLDVHLGLKPHRATEAAHRSPRRGPRRAVVSPAVQLRRRRRASLDVLRALQVRPGGRGRVPVLLRRRPRPPRPSRRRGVLRRVPERVPRDGASTGAPRRAGAGGRVGGGPGRDPRDDGGPGGRVGVLEDPRRRAHGQAPERVGVVELQGVPGR